MGVVDCPIVDVRGRRYRVQGGSLVTQENVETRDEAEELCSQNEAVQLEQEPASPDHSITHEKDYFLKRISADKEVVAVVFLGFELGVCRG